MFLIDMKRAVLMTSVFAVCTQTAYGQTKEAKERPLAPPDGKMMKPPDQQKFESRNHPALESENLKQNPNLPDLPEFTGKAKFVHGIIHNSEQGPNYLVRLHTQEDPKMVIDWYKNTLNMYKWKISSTGAETVTADKDGNNVAIRVDDISKNVTGTTDRTAIEINYFQQNRR